MLGKTTNPQLQAVEQAVQTKVPPELNSAFQRIVAAGEKVMYAPETRHLLQSQLSQKGAPADLAGQGVAKLMGLLFKESKGTMPMKAAIPAAQVLLCEALDFMEKAGLVQVGDDLIAEATKDMMAYLLQIFGFKKAQIDQYMHAGMASQGSTDGTMPASADAGGGAQAPAAGGIINSAQGAA
jgi:hypothetical protein